MNPTSSSRRDILKVAALSAAALPFAGAAAMAQNNRELLQNPVPTGPKKDPWKGLKIGVASYTFHKLPLETCVDAIKRIDLHYVSIKDSHLKLDSSTAERKAVVQKFRDAGIMPISCGVITIKLGQSRNA